MAHAGAPLDSFQSFVDDFTERTRDLKSLLLLRSSELDPNSQKVMEDMEIAISKAERSMNTLKCRIASECKSIRRAEELMALCHNQADQAENIKKAFASKPAHGRGSTGGEAPRGALARLNSNKSAAPGESAVDKPAPAAAEQSRAPPSISPVGEQELQGVPQYVRGRCSLARLNGVVEAINDVLAMQEELLGKAAPKLSEAQREQVKAWKELAAAHGKPNKPVLREEDLKTAGLKLTEASSKEVLGVLKHVQRLKEVRGAGSEKAFVCSLAR